MTGRLDGRTAIVTGASRGLGRAIALALAAGSAVWAVRQNQAYAAWVNHTYEVERAIAEGKITRDPGPARFEGGMRFDGKGGGTVEIGL
mgnify:CR=1 FL=1